MKTAYHVILHLLGLGCIAACLVIVGSKGDIDLYWSGWVAVAFFGMLALGILSGWFPWRGKPLRMLLKGIYVMSALALVGFGFSIDDPARPQLWMVLAPVAAAVVLRIPIRMTMGGRDDTAVDGPPRHRASRREHDPLI